MIATHSVLLLFSPLILGAGMAIYLHLRAVGRTGLIRFDEEGMWVTRVDPILLPWRALLSAELTTRSKDSRNKDKILVLEFNSSLLDTGADRINRFWLKKRKNTHVIEIDFRAVAERDQLKLVSVLLRLLPNRIGDNLSRFGSPEHNPSFTELWCHSLKAAERVSVRALLPGDWLNEHRFEIVRILGAGGQGIAYEAIDHYPSADGSSRVVLKEFIMPVHGDFEAAESALNMVQREARIIQSLNSEFIVRYYDLFVEDCRAYLVREFVDGMSLSEMVRQSGPFSQSHVYELGLCLCDILDQLHNQQPPIVHRDFTPDNVLLSSSGMLKLIDFDIAQVEEGVRTNQVVGKPSYLSPEQFQGISTTQSDIYSLGCTLFFLSTGKPPLPISVSRPKSVIPELDEQLDMIVASATSLDCDQRYRTISEVRRDLLQAVEISQ